MTGTTGRSVSFMPSLRARARAAWALTTFGVAQVVVCAAAAFPVILGWQWLLAAPVDGWRFAIIASLALPLSYGIFALLLMVTSALSLRSLGWRTPADTAMRIADLDWPLLAWMRYVSSIRVVNALAGSVFCGSPIWSAYLRLNGARVGRRVYVNSLHVSDHCLLDLDDDVVIGADVHLSGHTVEHGVVRTGRVRLGRGTTVGLGSIVGIDVEAGARCQIGALSLVPKHARLAAGSTYVGVPVRRVPGAATGYPAA